MNPRTIQQSTWQTQKNVVFSLFLRELKTRFGVYRMGYFWAVAEPIAMIGILSFVRLAFGAHDIAGVPFPLFFASGILPYTLFQHCATQGLSAVENNMALLNYKVVKPSDAIFARWILELVIYGCTGILIICGFYHIGYTFQIHSIVGMVSVLTCLALFSLGIAFLTAVIGPLYHESKKIVPILIRPLFFLSGIFFPADSLPVEARNILLWNPLLQVVELFRQSLFSNYQSHSGSLGYLALCAVVSLFVGLSVYRLFRIRLVTSGEIR